ncbi:predicted protein [Plenodomus lingam JN3]|uniref:Predicted protein n=1 Tax=Leptosphaeria maculans (strain JN3 / isolate v23.1.3 / race Av1-4-5-6-7-8) TaxID=985895 RepID=E5A461_LEPMJ|nr:predicted protein [Plenodomus lingam JN3]CBX98406.1 predicted protein [Plenodomus lingam JN3]
MHTRPQDFGFDRASLALVFGWCECVCRLVHMYAYVYMCMRDGMEVEWSGVE